MPIYGMFAFGKNAGVRLYWRALRFAKELPVQRLKTAYVWKMITLCGISEERDLYDKRTNYQKF